MKLYRIIEIFKERMVGIDPLPVFIVGFLVFFVVMFVLIRWGSGFLITLGFILTGLLLIRSAAIGGIALMARFMLVVVLSFYAFFSRKNKVYISKAAIFLALLPLVAILNSLRAYQPGSALVEGVLLLLFFVGFVIGGQRILGDRRGRATFTKFLAVFIIVMTLIQIPYMRSAYGLFEGAFETTVGFMIVGMVGTILLVWFAMRQRIWSISFIFCSISAAATFLLMVMTGGRTALGGTFLGVLIILSRKLKRNVVIALATLIILAPVGLKIASAIPGFEKVQSKLFSTTTTGRAELFRLAWEKIEEKPEIGWGTGTAFITSVAEKGTGYHNSYLTFAVDHGIHFAIIMLIVFLWLPFRGLFLMRKCHTDELKDMANLSAALLIAYVFSSYLGSVLNTTTGILPVYSVIALQEGVRAENREIELYGWEGEGEDIFWPDGLPELLDTDVLADYGKGL
ncbi:O-antigen ligase family protein [Planctomycetota bacterium]